MTGDVAVVLVAFNSAEEIGACLRSLRRVGREGPAAAAEIVVIDNASSDATCQVVSESGGEVRLIRNPTNRGFAAAVNQGVSATTRPLVLLLNPDTVLKTPLTEMAEPCRRPEVGAVGGKLVDSAGRPQIGFNVRSFPTPGALAAEVLLLNRLWPSNPINRRYRRLDLDPDQSQQVDQPAGAFLMLRRDVLEAVGGMDESFYPLWFEDVDLCLRIRTAGHEVRYTPGAVAEHRGAHSLKALPAQSRQLAWYGNLLRFGNKHFSRASRLWLRPLLMLGLLGRGFISLWGTANRVEGRAYWNTLRLLVGRRLSMGRGGPAEVRATSALES